MLGGATIRVREVARGAPPIWIRALGIVPRLATIPHFDRVVRYVNDATVRQVLDTLPDDLTLIGVDEDTALVRLEPLDDANAAEPRWQVMGRQTVTLFGGPRTVDGGSRTVESGQRAADSGPPMAGDQRPANESSDSPPTSHDLPSTVHGLSSIVHRIYRPGDRVTLTEGWPVAPDIPASRSSVEDKLTE